MRKATDSLEFHRARYGGEYAFDELRWARIRPCVRMVGAERRRLGRPLAVLDVGCGDGTASTLFSEGGNRVFGVDLVAEFVAKAIDKGIEAHVADVSKDPLPFADATFDAVYAGALIEHLYDPEFFLGECRRVLKEGGIVILGTPNVASLTSRLRMLFGRSPKFYSPALSWRFGGHIRLFTLPWLKRLLADNRFAVEEVTSNVVSFIPAESTRRPWSVALGKLLPTLGEVLIVKGRKRRADNGGA
ncbi:MAG: methyltransferase domain-containing protein [candidate division Zixibacteria bacterium]|nr:methyltransferase domain-containing protein [candidate division Zixibacteria bacterium]